MLVLTLVLVLLTNPTEGVENIAFGKVARQSGNFNNHPASKAVNGRTDDFSRTAAGQQVNWWTVNLGSKYSIGSIKLYNRNALRERLEKVSILTSNSTQPSDPSLSSDDWTRVHYRESAYPAVETHYFDPPIEGQHVAILNTHPQGLALAEVGIRDNNYSKNKTCAQSSYLSPHPASHAVDGDLSTYSSTQMSTDGWWKVDLGKQILLRVVKVSTRSGTQLTNVFFLTNPTNTGSIPNTDDNNDWNICSYSETPLGDEFTRSCDSGLADALTRQFSIFSTANTRIELKEIELRGHELPQLSTDIDVREDQVTTNSITISFIHWTQLMVGGLPPTEYRVSASNSGGTKTVTHSSSSQRLSVTLTGLYPGQSYTLTVSCYIQSVQCPGSSHFISLSTNCAAPEKPGTITLFSVTAQNLSRQRWKYTASWQTPARANCGDELDYRYKLNGGSLSSKQTTRTVAFYVDGVEGFTFSVRAENSVGQSEFNVKTGTSGALIPQFKSIQPTLTPTSPECVRLSRPEPEFPGGVITHYQYKCDDGDWTSAAGSANISVCEYQPYTTTECQLRAMNTAGWGYSQKKTTTTLCAIPDKPGTISFSATKQQNSGRQRWKYTASWQAPTRANCGDELQYSYRWNGGSLSSQQSTRSAVFYVDGHEELEISVRADNSIGSSEFRSKSVTSGDLNPQFKANQLTLTATSPYCVSLSKPEPQYPGGTITKYQYKCTNSGWKDAPDTQPISSCGYQPYATIKCQLRAMNTAGWGKSEKTTTTLCADPEFTKPPSAAESYDSIKKRRMVTVTAEDIETHCASLKSLEYKIPSREFSTSQVFIDLNALTSYNITIKATNNMDLSSNQYVEVTTGELEPWSEPVITDKYSENRSCVIVEWEEPLQPNGVIVKYKYGCTKSGEAYHGYLLATENSLRSCGYETGDLVHCTVRAATAIGFGPAEEIVVEVTCNNPSTPSFTLSSTGTSEDSATIDIFMNQLALSQCQMLSHSPTTLSP